MTVSPTASRALAQWPGVRPIGNHTEAVGVATAGATGGNLFALAPRWVVRRNTLQWVVRRSPEFAAAAPT